MDHGEKCRGSAGGWMISVWLGVRIRVLNPFNRMHFPLPSINTFQIPPDEYGCISYSYIRKAALARTLNSPYECMVMVIHGKQGRLSFSRPEDDKWTFIETCKWHPYEDVIYYNGQFHAVNHRGVVVVCHTGPHSKVTEFAPQLKAELSETRYLVESLGELFQVIRVKVYNGEEEKRNDNEANDEDNEANDVNGDEDSNEDEEDNDDNHNDEGHNDTNGDAATAGVAADVDRYVEVGYETVAFEIFKFDPSDREWVKVKSLRERALFLGSNSSFSVSATDFPACKGDCIYFTDDYWKGHDEWREHGGYDMGVFNLVDGSIARHYTNDSQLDILPPPFWLEPSP